MHDALIVGAGPAGLAVSRELGPGVRHVVLERGDRIGHTWANLYDGLVLHTGKHLSALPGMPFPAATPLFPSRLDFLDYLRRYAGTFRVPVETNADVACLRPDQGEWIARTTRGAEFRARAIVIATGIVSNPSMPIIPGRSRFRGRIMHSVEYRRPDEYAGQRVLVVGIGNSSGEISLELAAAAAHVTVAIRSGARVVPRQILGIPVQYFSVALSPLPRKAQRAVHTAVGRISELVRGAVLPPAVDGPCSNVPLIGLHFVNAVRAGRIRLKPGVAELTDTAARFTDGSEDAFDTVILATGYRAAVRPLGDLIRLDGCGFAARVNRVVSVDQPGLFFVGHNYDARGGLRNIAQDARLAARLVKRAERAPSASS
jgi:cation diffusion facilitator CzcD-associated flavoprotein CzcO